MITLEKRKTIYEALVEAIESGIIETTMLNVATYKVFYLGDIWFFIKNATEATVNQRIVGSEKIGSMLYVFF